MKNLVYVLLIGVVMTACKNEEKKPEGYVINGTAKGVYNGMRVYLKAADERGSQVAQDTAIVMDETFKFEGKVDYPQMWFLSVNNVNGVIPVMVENETIDVDFDKNNIESSKITGTKSNEALAAYTKDFKKLTEKRMDLNKEFSTIQNSNDSVGKAKVSADFATLNAEMTNYPYSFLEKNNDNYFALSLIETLLKSKPDNLDPLVKAFSNLDTDIKNSSYGKTVGSQIDVLKKQNESLAMLNVGNVAPDFSAPNPEGKQVSLNEIKGKATIIDFWASWCGPCRRENPNVVKVYNKYHDKGLEIISVSLDRPGQKDKWLKAIEDDKLTWHHVSNLNYFNDPVAQQYNIQSIPATYILDAEGKIVAKSLRGQALEDKIAEMLK